MDSRPRNNHGQFAPDEQGGMDPNTTSAAYNPQIIEARKATLAEKLRRAIGVRRGVEESVLQEQKVLSRFNHGGHGERGVKHFALPQDEEKGAALGTAAKVGLGTVGAAGAVVSGTRGYHAIKTVREVGKGSFRDGLSRIQRAHDFVGDKAVSALNKKASASAKAGWMGKFGKAGDFMAGNIFTKSMFSAKLRLRELAQGFAIPPEIAAPIMARRQELMKNPDYANVQGYLVKKDNQHIMESVLKRGGRPNIRDGQVVSAYFPGKKDLSAKLRLRELARQAAYDPYAMQAQPAEPGQAGRNFRNAAVGIGALGVGGGVAYAGWRGAQAAQSAQTLTDDALKTSAEARKAARSARVAVARVNRAGKAIKTQLTTFPTFKKVASKIFEEELKNLKELATRSVELNS
jgi:hypothetical protein